jgi:hypothetical protein
MSNMRKILITVAACLLFAAPAVADAPAFLPLQGVLTNTDGTPVDGDTAIRFALYTADMGGTELWNETQTVPVDQGFFTVYLGDTSVLDLSLFRDNESVWLGVRVGSDSEMSRFQVATTGFAGFAQYAGDAASLGGHAATDFVTSGSGVAWTDLTGVPADLADGDSDTTYSAGSGLTLTGTTFAADQAAIEGWATGVCYDTVAELRADLDSVYAAASHTHAWSTITGIPAGFADGVDNDVLGGLGCAVGQVAKWNGVSWFCAADADTNTIYSAGFGLTLTGTTFAADTSVVQGRVAGVCPAGQSIRAIDATGGVTCETDDNTTYTAGTGLTLAVGNVFSLDTTYADGRYLNEGTFYMSIAAIACVPMGAAPNPSDTSCSGGGTVRTNGSASFPCAVYGRVGTVDTFICRLDRPSGALIDEIVAYGYDNDATGYFEASTWRTGDATFGITYYSNFAGTWQNTGIAAAPGATSFPIFTFGTPAHTVLANNKYTIGFATYGNARVYGFRIRYRLT